MLAPFQIWGIPPILSTSIRILACAPNGAGMKSGTGGGWKAVVIGSALIVPLLVCEWDSGGPEPMLPEAAGVPARGLSDQGIEMPAVADDKGGVQPEADSIESVIVEHHVMDS
jgi:hypothetical protein